MNTRFWYGHCLKIGIVLAATSGYVCSQRAIAQIVPDRTLGVESSIVTPVDIKGLPSDRIDAGAIRGANLFHSFQEFNIRDGRGAYFSNPAGIENIFSRVTGTNASNIFGKLGVLGNANLFLLNPNGIIFGPNAKLDIAGSFSASTGNSFNFGDAKFSATNPTDAPLLSVKVPLGVQFNQNQPSAIANSGNLSVGTGQNLNLMGGTVVSTGQLSAAGGQVAVAAVPGGSVVNLSPSAQFLNVETSSPVASVGSSSLSELLTSVDERSRPGLTVNSNGQVQLTGSGLPVVDGDVVARNVTAQTATLTANNNLTLVESQIGTTGDLNLLARDTVRVRDSVTNPFVAQAGGNLTIRGNQGIDILALNHPQTPFVSGGNLSLLSNGIISGDAHFSSGGNFSILNLSGSGGNFVSLYDPIIRSNGDVTIGNYTGASLKIEAAGNITTGAITINSAEGSAAIDVNDPDYQTLTNGKALILRSGNDTLSGSVQEPDPLNGASNVNYSSSRSSAGNLTINGNIRSDNFATPFTVELKASGDIIAQDINTAGFSNQGGNISITASRNITTGNLDSFIDYRGNGDGGDIKLNAGGEIIKTGRIISTSSNGVAGDVNLTAAGNIRSGSIEASSNSNDQGFSTIQLNSSTGSVFLNGVRLSTTNTGTDYAGDIYINGKNIQITNTGLDDNQGIQSKGAGGRIFIGIDDKGNVTADNVTIRNSRVDTLRNVNSNLPPVNDGIKISSRGEIQIIEGSKLVTTTTSTAPSGSITLDAKGSVSLSNDAELRVNTRGTGNAGQINIKAQQLSLRSNSGLIGDVDPNGNGNGASVNLDVTGEILLDGDGGGGFPGTGESTRITVGILANGTQRGEGAGGNITIKAGSLVLKNGAIIKSSTQGGGNAGNISVEKADVVDISGSVAESGLPSGFFTSTSTDGKAGDITVNTRIFRIADGAALSARTTGTGQGGTITVKASSFEATNGGQLVTTTSGSGKAGDIFVNATDRVTISGNDPNYSNRIAKFPNPVDPRVANDIKESAASGLFANTGENSRGAGGNITVGDISKPNLFRISDGAVLVTSTSSSGDAGNITINANRFEAINGGQLIARTTSNGDAGTIMVNADRRVTISGRDTNFANRRSQFGNGVVANVITDPDITNPKAEVFSGFFVRSSGSGQAGDIEINSPIVLLDNQGRLDANSNSRPGGNIRLNQGRLLLLRRNSLIITNNEGTGDGGNITINYPRGFIIAGFGRNNDIQANARSRNGGRVDITALGVVNIEALSRKDLMRRLKPKPEPLDPQRLPTSDITAISQENPNLNGRVNLNAPDVDPTRGTIQLPEDLGDSSKLIARSCPVGTQGAASRFIITGRGGLPPNPASALSTDTFLGNAANTSENATASTSVVPQEAQGVEIGSRGEIILTARPSTLTPHTPWQRLRGCYGK